MAGLASSDRRRAERGAILIYVAAALLTFTMLSALVIDYGMALVSRHQVQNAADSAALAGADALAWDDYTNHSATGAAASAAQAVAQQNAIWGAAPSAASTDIAFPVCPDSSLSPTQTPISGVRAGHDLSRRQPQQRAAEHDRDDVRRRHRGRQRAGGGRSARRQCHDCLKPIAVPDKWAELAPSAGAWTAASTFAKWDPANPSALLSPHDVYTAPGWDFNGTGLTMTGDFGTAVTLTPGSVADAGLDHRAVDFLAVRIPASVNGITVRADVNSCAVAHVAIGDRSRLVPGNDPARSPAARRI